MKAMADRAIASFGNHYPVDAEYRSELEKNGFNFDYDRFLQPLRSKDNHRNSEVVQDLVEHCFQAMSKHAHDVSQENKRKGDEVVEHNYQTRRVLIDRQYNKQSNAWAIVGGATGGVFTAGAPLLAVPGVNVFAMGLGAGLAVGAAVGAGVLSVCAAGATAGGWGAAKLSDTYLRTSRYELQKRYMKMQVNGRRCFSKWAVIEEITETDCVEKEEEWTKGEVSEESKWHWDGN